MLRPEGDPRRGRWRNDRKNLNRLKDTCHSAQGKPALGAWWNLSASPTTATTRFGPSLPPSAAPPASRKSSPAAWQPSRIWLGGSSRLPRTRIFCVRAGSQHHPTQSSQSAVPIYPAPGGHCPHSVFCRASCCNLGRFDQPPTASSGATHRRTELDCDGGRVG